MISRLDSITDWEKRAESANFRVAALAKSCKVTDRQLRRYLRRKFGCSPHIWMTAIRLRNVCQLLSEGNLVKEAAARAGFTHREIFSRQFKRYYETSPSSLRLPEVNARLAMVARLSA